MKIVIIGSGVAGSTLANLLKKDGHNILVLEKDKTPGGMCKSYYKEGFVYEYGSHILAMHNCSNEAAEFLKKNIDTNNTELTTASFVNNTLTYYPPSIYSAEKLGLLDKVKSEIANRPKIANELNFETYLIDKVGLTLYETFFKNFTKKFWNIEPNLLSADWAKIRKLGDKIDSKRMFFNEKWCSYPKNDWNDLFINLLKEIDVIYDCEVLKVDTEKNIVSLKSGEISYDLLISTMHIDQLFDFKLGKLEYAGYRVEPVILDKNFFIKLDNKPISMTYFPDQTKEYTRVTDYGSFQNKKRYPYINKTIVTYEYPDHKNRFYSFTDKKNLEMFENYLQFASNINNVISFGRSGLYKYVTSDTTVDMAFRLIKFIKNWPMMSNKDRFDAYKIVRGDWSN